MDQPDNHVTRFTPGASWPVTETILFSSTPGAFEAQLDAQLLPQPFQRTDAKYWTPGRNHENLLAAPAAASSTAFRSLGMAPVTQESMLPRAGKTPALGDVAIARVILRSRRFRHGAGIRG